MDIKSMLSGAMNSVTNWLSDFINEIQAVLFALLPDSPFQFTLPREVTEILGYINWVIPFYMIGNTLLVWCSAILIYYAYQTILRWIKSIQ